jgi:hypothetical protein
MGVGSERRGKTLPKQRFPHSEFLGPRGGPAGTLVEAYANYATRRDDERDAVVGD